MTEADAVMVDAMLEAGARLEEFAPTQFAVHRTSASKLRLFVSPIYVDAAPFEYGDPQIDWRWKLRVEEPAWPVFLDGFEELTE